ncbi:putative phosphoribosyl transferase [Thermasporomyces composti]|jgi:putative phosphoribosyl transferase|uniref:Putative phosphoribosyl transferase n=2 Tax=Thermasporomyces composti TaxID=696763 RepID=A0A3D9V402_THECX|nr:putative phosphoribosyl transferase [Thermasporomyces composti]
MMRRGGASTAGYADRADAGHRLADELAEYAHRDDVIVLGLPRGGVVTAAAVAERLGVALDVFCVRKLGVPWHPELAMGAVATGGVRVLNRDVVEQLGISPAEVEQVAQRERAELARREATYRGDRPPAQLEGKVVILVDDGIATGATARAAVVAVRRHQPAKVILAVPVAPPQAVEEFAGVVDEMVCPLTPPSFEAVGRWYTDFRSVSDAEVRALLT